MAKRQLTPKSEDMSKWYTQVIQQAKLADYSPVKGCMVIRPNGYGIWENIHDALDPLLKGLGVQNAYFPLFIPMSFLNREADHVKGFAPELAIVTHGGGEELEEKLAVRPTSETIMYEMYSKWVQSYRDLPILINQWNNVVRWEKRTYFFLRTTEFLWQEAHTAHATHAESFRMVMDGLEAYRNVAEESMAIPVIMGRKSNAEKFAGAAVTTTIEAMMPDGKALQAGTSHDLGQNFSKKEAFNIAFQNKEGKMDYAWQVSYGFSTRTIGALIMVHGDDDGIVIPPKIAPTQVSIIPTEQDEAIMHRCNELLVNLKKGGIRAKLLFDAEHSLGWRMNESEIEGVPLALVLGKKELEANSVTAKIRYNHSQETIDYATIESQVQAMLNHIQQQMFAAALKKQKELTSSTESYDEFKNIMKTKRGFLKAFWCEDETCEKTIKDETKASTRCLPFIDKNGQVAEEKGTCIKCGKAATHRWLFAQAY
ncbi:MAG: proline--tRNA ligase [Candidatus Roizmanbacteria bacterium]|nr:proline--tRNA ligase [Candidatus Roizmanbacteria bacterium]